MHGNMNGNMHGNMYGNIHGNMHGNMHGSMYGKYKPVEQLSRLSLTYCPKGPVSSISSCRVLNAACLN
jgi:hypothetical protein